MRRELLGKGPNTTRLAVGVFVLAAGWLTTGSGGAVFSLAVAHADENGQPVTGKRTPASVQSPAAAVPAQPKITRADLAAAYLRLEQEYFANPPTGEKMIEVNRGFDQATLAFFTGRNADAIRTIDGLTNSLRPQNSTPAQQVAVSLKVAIEPPVWVAGRPLRATARVQSVYEAPLPRPTEVDLRVRLVDPDGKKALDPVLMLIAGPGHTVDISVPLELAADRLVAGVYRVELAGAEERGVTAARVSVVAGPSLDEQRTSNKERLAKIEAPSAGLAEALASCKARNALLTDRLSDTNSAQFLADLQTLASDVAQEIDAVASGKDPYVHRSGDYWRVMTTANGDIPLRVYAPERATKDEPVPLLVVLHGAGGDENMFLEAYGVGVIKKIADEKGLLIASPLTYRFGGSPQNFDKLIDVLSHDYAIDRHRIYVLGHSMGAGVVAGLARSRADSIAAACCIAGGSFVAGKSSAPVLAVVAELDAVVPAKGLQSTVEKAAAAGTAIELRLMPGYGHTLVVGAVLPAAVDWLLSHSHSTKSED